MTDKIAVVFDMDGVIIHSNPLITKAWRNFFNELNIVLDDDQLKHYVFGRTSEDTLRLVFNKPLNPETIRGYQRVLEKNVQELYVAEGSLTPGFKPFVEELIANDIAVAIATAAPPENVSVVMNMGGTATYFPIITDANDVHHSKPHPEVYLTTAAKLDIEPSRCVVFEDSFSGIQSAKAAGMKVIGVTTTHAAEEFATETKITIHDFTEASVEMVRSILS